MALLAEAENQTVGVPLPSGFLPAWVDVREESARACFHGGTVALA